MTEHQWTVLTTADNEALAELTRQRLEGAKIPAVLETTGLSAYQGASAPVEIKVPEEKLAEAHELLND